MGIRGVRGAITCSSNTPEAILEATARLLVATVEANGIDPQEVASVIFTTSQELNAAFPAEAARRLGWVDVPLLCAQEVPVPGALPMAVRILLHWNTDLPATAIRHVYLDGAVVLRPDLPQEAAARV